MFPCVNHFLRHTELLIRSLKSFITREVLTLFFSSLRVLKGHVISKLLPKSYVDWLTFTSDEIELKKNCPLTSLVSHPLEHVITAVRLFSEGSILPKLLFSNDKFNGLYLILGWIIYMVMKLILCSFLWYKIMLYNVEIKMMWRCKNVIRLAFEQFRPGLCMVCLQNLLGQTISIWVITMWMQFNRAGPVNENKLDINYCKKQILQQ